MDEQKITEKNEKEKYAFFPGCLIQIQLPLFEKLSRDILAQLNVELVDSDFTCCPNYNLRGKDEFSWLVVAARNLAIAEQKKLNILTLCGGCMQTLKEANEKLRDKILLLKVNRALEKTNLQYNCTTVVKHILEVFYENMEGVGSLVKKPLYGIKAATHTGCHLLRPSRIQNFDDPENPKKLDELSSLLGCNTVDYKNKSLCCGVAIFSEYKEGVLNSVKEKINSFNADCLVVGCATCFLQYNKSQLIIKTQTPVLHYLQLLGLASGLSLEKIGYNKINRIRNRQFEENLKTTIL